MQNFILNNTDITTDQPPGMTVLDFVRYHKNLKGTKIGCREGDCGACTILVGELVGSEVKYRTMTSCLMPLANAAGKHIVTIEGVNPADRGLTLVQQAMIAESGTQCGFCTVGFVMSLTGFCIDETSKTSEMAVSAVDGNICRCTGYKSIERAACKVSALMSEQPASAGGQLALEEYTIVPAYFAGIGARLKILADTLMNGASRTDHPLTQAVPTGGGTDLYVQRPDAMAESYSVPLFYDENLRGIRDVGGYIEVGGSVTVTDLLVSPVMQSIFPGLYKHLKLVSSTPIRNMATLAGNFVNASPIGDMTVWFLALDAQISLVTAADGNASVKEPVENAEGTLVDTRVSARSLPLRDLYLGYKQLANQPDEIITTIRFRKPTGDFRFNFEKVSKRTYLDISTVNTAISLRVSSPHVSEGHPALTHVRATDTPPATNTIINAHVSAGGVAPIPLYLKKTSAFLKGKQVNEEIIGHANEIMQSEISPISDVRGTEQYKRLLLRQLFTAHFVELFEI